MKWILIIVFGLYGFTAEFDSQKTCNDARTLLVMKANKPANHVIALCVPK